MERITRRRRLKMQQASRRPSKNWRTQLCGSSVRRSFTLPVCHCTASGGAAPHMILWYSLGEASVALPGGTMCHLLLSGGTRRRARPAFCGPQALCSRPTVGSSCHIGYIYQPLLAVVLYYFEHCRSILIPSHLSSPYPRAEDKPPLYANVYAHGQPLKDVIP